MAATNVQTGEVEMQRAELKSVLASQDFVRAPKLAHLLAYLCDSLFAGKANQIKEYSIGLEVFHRGTSFDQDSDSIVRVEANRLRKRLAEYYASEGASHLLQITIPVGQYVPRFDTRIREAAAIEGPALSGVKAGPKTAGLQNGLPRKWWMVLISAGLLCAVLLGYAIYWRRVPAKIIAPIVASVPSEESQFGPPSGEEIRILAGANRSLVDHAGKLWSADAGFSGGKAVR